MNFHVSLWYRLIRYCNLAIVMAMTASPPNSVPLIRLNLDWWATMTLENKIFRYLKHWVIKRNIVNPVSPAFMRNNGMLFVCRQIKQKILLSSSISSHAGKMSSLQDIWVRYMHGSPLTGDIGGCCAMEFSSMDELQWDRNLLCEGAVEFLSDVPLSFQKWKFTYSHFHMSIYILNLYEKPQC